MYVNLKSESVGDFLDVEYWSSSEYEFDGAYVQDFADGSSIVTSKSTSYAVRAFRSYTSQVIYALRDIGESGGLIFYIVNLGGGNYRYYESSISDLTASAWSNIVDAEIGTTETAIGTGASNTLRIISQTGHAGSAAKLCNDIETNVGNPLAFCELSNGDILYTTDTGFVVNYTTGQSVKVSVSVYDLTAITFDNINGVPVCADEQGQAYALIEGIWTTINNTNYQVNAIICKATRIYFTTNGIYSGNILIQSGNFTCAIDAGSGVLYAGTADGHIWKSVDSGSIWNDLGDKTNEAGIITSIIKNNNRFIIAVIDDAKILYTDDDFETMIEISIIIGVNCFVGVDNNTIIGGTVDARILISNNNGNSFGNPEEEQYMQTSINCLIST
jgi:hypothetical protein